MAISFNKTKQKDTTIIKDNVGFTFTLDDGAEGFGFIFPTENNHIVISVVAMYNELTVGYFSALINEYDNINPYSSIEEFLKDYFDADVNFVKGYRELREMNITVDLEME